jgi:hypothetical protein
MKDYTATAPKATVAISRAMKCLARALDPATLDGEAETSAVICIRTLRGAEVGLEQFTAAIMPARRAPSREKDAPPAACEIKMPFGKHQGLSLGEIAKTDPGYLVWLTENLRDRPDLVNACESVAIYFGLARPAEAA